MKVSVIMPVHNRASFVAAALESLLVQRADCALDIIVVDDGSTDESAAVVTALAAANPEIRLIRTINQGAAAARNLGLRNLPPDCDFVTFLDSDDVSVTGRLAKDLREFEARPELDLTYGNVTMTARIDPVARLPMPGARFVTLRSIYLGAGIYRKALIDRTGFFDESFVQGEDTDFLLRMFESGANYLLTETNTACYQIHPGNMTKDRDVVMRYLARALHFSIARRRRNPGTRIPDSIFNMHPVLEFWASFDESV